MTFLLAKLSRALTGGRNFFAGLAATILALPFSWRGRFIFIMVTSQLLFPLHYYISRRDPHDERFAWRMFSPMRMARCEPSFLLDGKPFALGGMFHEAWIETAARGRFSVVEAMGAEVCRRNPNAAVVVSLRCTYLDREPITWGGFNICNVPLL